jgi:hypothetical protein
LTVGPGGIRIIGIACADAVIALATMICNLRR